MAVDQRVRMRSAVLIVISALLLGACASHPSSVRPSEGGPTPNWDQPLVGGIPEPSAAAAAASLTFSPREDPSLGAPASTLITDPNGSTPASRAIAFVYHQSPYGTLNVIQEISQTTQQGLEDLVQHNGAPGDTATLTLVTLTGGRTAVLETGPVSNSIMWLEGPVLFTVLGPSETFSASDAEAVADQL